uniref:Uncharacterized protein n=1 Tax=Compsopogon caeruleus TaxID=31354 RepID=A0A7S1XFJ8_9RHOD|mmetsp:Transcript_3334/g.6270  ORF Transcript_3334/g.6270 Transcript_3334/m.6270 type:complete len:776 (+) Transcript_3334:102-2429(+)|eukprot:CAMPEP_0184680506 /NCGR_PEP_ID=MMETSP0312-20130426/3393_1 /TAXON_ID=31354 /ORGANISM="Compsopogon coeruleus, Strain SAG 36.94" /LENGTH=775 /DNA_ID=CAMNT_0027130659 /DNA_START=88 /DNA_END=2415 /DNA_ORIENTATION=+
MEDGDVHWGSERMERVLSGASNHSTVAMNMDSEGDEFLSIGGGAGFPVQLMQDWGPDPRDPRFFAGPAREGPIVRVRKYIESRAGISRPEDEVSLLDTFMYMRMRAWKRYQINFRWGTAKFAAWWFYLYLILLVVFVVLRSTTIGFPQFDHFLVILFLSIIVAYGTPRSATLYKILASEFYLALYFYFLFQPVFHETSIASFGDLGFFILVITPGVMLATILAFSLWPRIFYKIKKSRFRKYSGQFSVEETPMPDNPTPEVETISTYYTPDYFQYIRRFRVTDNRAASICVSWRERKSAIYVGPVLNGRPHGLGQWIDEEKTGENLVGYFHDGIPVGPFESMENGGITRNLLINLRILYMTCGSSIIKIQRAEPLLGVASCECSVSGEVLFGYPKEADISPPNTCGCQDKDSCVCFRDLILSYYRHIDETKRVSSILIGVDKSWSHLTVSGHRPRMGRRPKEVTISLVNDAMDGPGKSEILSPVGYFSGGQLKVQKAWKPLSDSETVVYIPGYKHTKSDCVRRFGQFLAMAHLPPHMKPSFFHWPTGAWAFSYKNAIRVCKSEENQIDFEHFLLSLRNAGIRNANLMLHSMGARVFFYAWPRIRRLFRPLEVQDEDLEFDFAADDASVASRNAEPLLNLQNIVLLAPDFEVDSFQKLVVDLRRYASQITLYVDRRDTATRTAQVMRGYRESLGYRFSEIDDAEGNFVDMDIIETTDLDSNVAGTYHSYWNINRMMVDDLHELLVLKKRADTRFSRLLRTGGVYRFVQTPHTVIEV